MTQDPPRDFQSLKNLILNVSESLPKRLRQVAVFALDKPDEIAFGTAASIAASASVQPSTLVRFAQAIGFDGFSDLQTVFRERLRERGASYDERLETVIGAMGSNGVNQIYSGVIATASASIDAMVARIHMHVFEEAIAVLAKADTIYLVAQRRAFPVTTYLAYILGKMKVRAHLVTSPFGIEPEMMAFAGPNDAALAVSFAPYAAATLEHARILNGAGVPIVSITDTALSPLTPLSRVWFEVAENDFAGFRSITATMALANAIAIGIGEERRRLKA
ncbi:MAG: MurR/RpiR family transcriptional regulator [Rhizobiaceae bacterium]